MVSDDDRQRRRLGDATRDRIADLADGWSVPVQRPDTAEESVGYEVLSSDDVPPPEALEVLRQSAQRRSDDSIRRNLTPMRLTRQLAVPAVDDDATTIDPPPPGAARRAIALREVPRLPRRPGLLGDLRYVLTVLRGVRAARRELLDVDDRLTTLKADRAARLADLGRAAIADDRFDQTAVRTSRDLLADIEDQRSRHAGAAAAVDAELEVVERARLAELERLAAEEGAAAAEVQRLDGEIAPLERASAAAHRRAAQVKETLADIDGRIAAARATLASRKGAARDAAAVEADLASLRADRDAVAADEPAIALELDALVPRLAALDAARTDAQARIAAARAADADARGRAEEQVAALQARRRVEHRAAVDARTASDRALVELGERLYVERPADLTSPLGAVDRQDVTIATTQRRAIELRELIGSVHRGALWRGVAVWAALVGAAAAILVVLVA